MTRYYNPLLCLSVAVLTLLLSVGIESAESPDYVLLAKSSLAEMDKTDPGSNWFYTMTSDIDGEILVTRNDPGNQEGSRRELISVNGEVPSEERLEAFQERELKRFEEKEGENGQDKFSDMIDLTTLVVTDVSNGQATLSFIPALDGFEKDSDKLDGSLLLNTETHMIEELKLVNTGKISPAFSVSLTTFMMKFSFSRVDGVTLLNRMATSIEGKAGFLKKFKSDTKIVFSNYQRL